MEEAVEVEVLGREEQVEEVFLNYRKTPTRGKSAARQRRKIDPDAVKTPVPAYCTCYH